ncbi:PREDICTED: uncharacterized protein LOC104721054 [Camelina sativa]|uniref:S-protein homolog n=1 Tax=Camelina sativa TaxID=90675 RepID=A0ABM0U7V8_CAMSA|nr:PREDICTED: uncharacterized protein LOC104721054 [Camelina sativa]XP_010437273.1 PREDICTED: uncharacterized protein LOC104721054 [Camelina sativa]XP_010437278.1 PREDICTED: uncharacterized protein LOC104721054 [Camelina sativa]XP_010437284.1 PREDICTED: uncharacterized protein LOC104721054 [Camelina sativa]XP_010437291.1 PREDICTED: uncharacterized protein LOC104721054 [Camelina sativa]XP_010437296.1 PREDICTED: uncharacterized protein LOC104721054 [Camelina sativa]XP_010437299.1 PREDICTED: unc
MGKILTCLLFLIFISIQKIDSILIFRKFNIEISNHLAGNKILMINCRYGKSQATRVVFLSSNTEWKLKFTVYPKTLIWCNLWKGPDYVQHVKFNAFIGKESFIHNICGGRKPNICFWKAQEDGIYVRKNAAGTFKFMYKWDRV